jgi:hypothetical protein
MSASATLLLVTAVEGALCDGREGTSYDMAVIRDFFLWRRSFLGVRCRKK